MRVSHKAEYGLRAVTAIARFQLQDPTGAVPSHVVAEADDLPATFLTPILTQLRHAQVLRSHRGRSGGWSLRRPAIEISVADVIRSLDGPLASVRGVPPSELEAHGIGEPFVALWLAVDAALRSVLERVTIADLAAGALPEGTGALAVLGLTTAG